MEAVEERANPVVRGTHQAVDFFRAVRAEMSKVTWPNRAELIRATRMIIVLSVALGLVIGWMDLLFNLILVDGVARLTR